MSNDSQETAATLPNRLRAFEGSDDLANGDFSVLEEAIAEIDRLRAENARLREENSLLREALAPFSPYGRMTPPAPGSTEAT